MQLMRPAMRSEWLALFFSYNANFSLTPDDDFKTDFRDTESPGRFAQLDYLYRACGSIKELIPHDLTRLEAASFADYHPTPLEVAGGFTIWDYQSRRCIPLEYVRTDMSNAFDVMEFRVHDSFWNIDLQVFSEYEGLYKPTALPFNYEYFRSRIRCDKVPVMANVSIFPPANEYPSPTEHRYFFLRESGKYVGAVTPANIVIKVPAFNLIPNNMFPGGFVPRLWFIDSELPCLSTSNPGCIASYDSLGAGVTAYIVCAAFLLVLGITGVVLGAVFIVMFR
jgi:hypothetical protein